MSGGAIAPARSPRYVLLWGSAGGFLGFYLALAAIPSLAGERGGNAAPGVLTAALMLSTVATQAVVPQLLRRWSAPSLLVAGLWLLGAPALVYGITTGVLGLVVVTLVRGVGFGLMTVMGSLLATRYADHGERGRALGLYGLVSSASGAVAPAIGVAALHASPYLLAAIAAVPPILAAVGVVGRLPALEDAGELAEGVPSLWRHAIPILVFFPAAAAFGAVFSYLPHVVTGSGAWLLVAFGVCFSLGRVVPGHAVDRGLPVGAAAGACVLVAAAGLGLLAIASATVPAAVGAALAGLGVGGACTTTLVMMVAGGDGRMDHDAQAAAAWNITYDAGTGIGGLALGLVAVSLGVHAVFLVAAAFLVGVGGPAAVAALAKSATRDDAHA